MTKAPITSSSSSADETSSVTTMATTQSTASETSAAIVSLYNSWTSDSVATGSTLDTDKDEEEEGDADTTTNSTLPDDHPPSLHHRHVTTAATATATASNVPMSIYEMQPVMSADELLAELQKRLRPGDLPKVAPLRRRKRPTCQFLNFLGTRHRHQDSASPPPRALMPPPSLSSSSLPSSHHQYPHEVETQRFLSEIDFGFEDENDDDELDMDPIPAFSSKFKHSPKDEDDDDDDNHKHNEDLYYLHLQHNDSELTKEAPLSPPRKKQRRDTMTVFKKHHQVTGERA